MTQILELYIHLNQKKVIYGGEVVIDIIYVYSRGRTRTLPNDNLVEIENQ